MGGADPEFAYAIAVDAAGNVYTTGDYDESGDGSSDPADFDPGPGTFLLDSEGSGGAFISKLNAAGEFVFAKSFESSIGNAIAVDASLSVYTAGRLSGTVDLDPGPGTYIVQGIQYVSKLDANGNFVYGVAFQGTSGSFCTGIAVDPAGNAYTTGGFDGSLDLDPGPGTHTLVCAGYHDIYISKLDPQGNCALAVRLGGSGDEDSTAGIALDAQMNIYIAGYFNAPGTAFRAYKLNAAGETVYIKQVIADVSGMAVDPDGDLYTTGSFNGTQDFDPGPGVFNLTSTTPTRLFVSKLIGVPTYLENGPPLALAPGAIVAGALNYADGRLTVKATAGGSMYDVLEIANQGTGSGQIGVSGDTVSYQGQAIGTFSGGTNYQPLVIDFSSSAANTAAAQALVRAITFRNTSESPYTAQREILFTLTDGHGATAYPAEKLLTVVSVNDAPTMSAPSYVKTPKNAAYTFSGNPFNIGDVDAGNNNIQLSLAATKGTLTLSTTVGLTFTYGSNGGVGFTIKGKLADINSAITNLQFTPNNNFYGLGTLALTINDFGNTGGGNLSASTLTNISVYDPNEIVVFPYDPEFTTTQPWTTSSLPGYNGTPSLYGHGVATWTPVLPGAGNYKVEFYRVVHAGDGGPIKPRVSVTANGMTTDTQINFSTGSSGFIDLGTHFFNGDGDEYVSLTTSNGDILRASAVRFTLIE